MGENYISLAQAWLAFCDGADHALSISDLKLRFKREVADPLKASTFEMTSFVDSTPIGFRTWFDYFGSDYPRIWLQSIPDNIAVGDFFSRQDFAEVVSCKGHHFRFPSNICFSRRAFDALSIWRKNADAGRGTCPGRARGRRPKVGERVAEEMLRDLRAGKISGDEKEQWLEGNYSASRDTCRKSLKKALSEFNSRQFSTIDK